MYMYIQIRVSCARTCGQGGSFVFLFFTYAGVRCSGSRPAELPSADCQGWGTPPPTNTHTHTQHTHAETRTRGQAEVRKQRQEAAAEGKVDVTCDM